jgi:tRNA (adenine57-N1/adenine58-N1)-methyltransferase
LNPKELVLLLAKDESYLLEVNEREFHTQRGIINLKELKKKKFGDKIKTHKGSEFVIVKPNLKDILEKRMKRLPQIIMSKDAALFLSYTGIMPDSLVVDAGTGSGFLAIFLANYLSSGKVVTYENDKRFVKIARLNIKNSGLSNIKLKVKDVSKGITERNVDLITLDMKNAERIVKYAYKALKPGGWLVVYSPYVEQVVTVNREIGKKSFCAVKTVESIVREWQIEKYTRPKTVGLMHTGFLTFARKVS